MKFDKSNVEKYTFRFESGDKVTIDDRDIYIGGGHAVFVLDCATFTLLTESDWGFYGYRWGVSSGETFKQLMCRIGGEYLCGKLSSRTEIDWEKTKNRAVEVFKYHARNKYLKQRFLEDLKYVDHNDVRFYDFMEEYVDDCEASYFCKDFPFSVKIVVAVFEKYLIPELEKEISGVRV